MTLEKILNMIDSLDSNGKRQARNTIANDRRNRERENIKIGGRK